jgi:triacylglycerol lipase
MSYPRKSLPMYFPSTPFSLPDAVLCTDLVITAYDMYAQWKAQDYPTQPNFIWTPHGPAMAYTASIWGQTWWFPYRFEPFAFVAYSAKGNVYLALRGTETDSDWIDDLDVSQTPYSLVSGYGKVHKGFMDIYGSMSPAVLATVNSVLQKLGPSARAFYFAAHSLGAALSTLSVPDLIANSNLDPSKIQIFHYPLASPRVGDPDFYYQYTFQVVPTYRIINTEDVVPDLPPSVVPGFGYIYKHIGLPVTYTAQYDSDAGNHDYRNSYYYALNNPFQPEGPIVPQVAELAASARLLRLKKENDLLKRLLAQKEMTLALTRGESNV